MTTALGLGLSAAGWLLLALHQVADAIWQYLADHDHRHSGTVPLHEGMLPLVTIQLPVCNERYVIDRLIDSCCALTYPREQLEIQILDDSSDETTARIADKARHYRSVGFDIHHLRRPDRRGYKAGNLQHGLTTARGEFIAVFDADCMPVATFLLETLPYFQDATVGIVHPRQIRHINRDRSWLTRAQDPFGDFPERDDGFSSGAHFNFFFGSPGVIRRACLDAVGGWQADTLCEDVDFSVRTYLKGWRCVLPGRCLAADDVLETLDGVKQQVERWKKGNAECSRKHVPGILRDRACPLPRRLAVAAALQVPWLHIPALTLIALATVPLLLAPPSPWRDLLLALPTAAVVLLAIAMLALRNGNLMLSALLNLAIYFRAAWASCAGLVGIRSPFVRSAKVPASLAHPPASYAPALRPSIAVEGVLALYFSAGTYVAVTTGQLVAVPFQLACVLGCAMVFTASVAEVKRW